MKVKVTRMGDGIGLYLPSEIASSIGVTEGSDVEVSVESGVIRIARKRTLDELISQITPDNLREEVDFGDPRGRESW